MTEPRAPYDTGLPGCLDPEIIKELKDADAGARADGAYEYSITVKVAAAGTSSEAQSVHLSLQSFHKKVGRDAQADPSTRK